MGQIYHGQHDNKTVMEWLTPYIQVAKLPLCLMVAFSAAFGYVMASPVPSVHLLSCTFAVLLLAAGAASYNSLQEKKSDGLMNRTRKRPLVVNAVTSTNVAIQASFLIFLGLFLLLIVFEKVGPMVVGVAAVIIYNVVYTNLKRVTVFSIIPGAICGALPPYIGWLAGGGDPLAYSAAILFLLFVLWQIPHFFLVLLNHKSDYARSVTPNMLKLLHESGLRRLFVTWVGALAACMLFFPVIPSTISNLDRGLICANALVLFAVFVQQLFFRTTPHYRFLFIYLNFSIFFIMFVIIAGNLGKG